MEYCRTVKELSAVVLQPNNVTYTVEECKSVCCELKSCFFSLHFNSAIQTIKFRTFVLSTLHCHYIVKLFRYWILMVNFWMHAS